MTHAISEVLEKLETPARNALAEIDRDPAAAREASRLARLKGIHFLLELYINWSKVDDAFKRAKGHPFDVGVMAESAKFVLWAVDKNPAWPWAKVASEIGADWIDVLAAAADHPTAPAPRPS